MKKIDYSQLSDREINIQVARIIHPEREVIESKSRPPSACVIGHLPSKWLDYCNNPADAWPIIVENRISIMFDGTDSQYEGEHHEWCDVISPCQKYSVQYQSNPLRAAMIVFLEMQ
ncbi:MAG: phage protein NinX family protein [Enterobacter roggenkampii]